MTVAEFFTNLENGSTWSAGVAFKRSNPLPIDRYSVFKTEADALSYVKTNAVAYPGQIVATVSDKEAVVYVIASVGASGKLVKLAASSTASDISDLLAALTERVAALEARIGDDDISSIFPTDPVTPEEEQTITKALLILKEVIDNNTSHINKKVDSVTAADKSITVTTATTKDGDGYNVNAVTVKANVSSKADNVLKLDTTAGKEGLYVQELSVLTPAPENTAIAKTYKLMRGDNQILKIDIPKDMVVSDGVVETYTAENAPADPSKSDGSKLAAGTYIVLTIANKKSDKLYIPADTLIEYVTAGTAATGDGIQVNISDDHKVTATLLNDAVTTVKIKDANVTKAKLADDVQASLDSALQQADIKTGTDNGNINVKGTDVKVKGINNAAYKDVATTVTATAETLPTSKAVAAYVTDAVDSALYVSRWTE